MTYSLRNFTTVKSMGMIIDVVMYDCSCISITKYPESDPHLLYSSIRGIEAYITVLLHFRDRTFHNHGIGGGAWIFQEKNQFRISAEIYLKRYKRQVSDESYLEHWKSLMKRGKHFKLYL